MPKFDVHVFVTSRPLYLAGPRYEYVTDDESFNPSDDPHFLFTMTVEADDAKHAEEVAQAEDTRKRRFFYMEEEKPLPEPGEW